MLASLCILIDFVSLFTFPSRAPKYLWNKAARDNSNYYCLKSMDSFPGPPSNIISFKLKNWLEWVMEGSNMNTVEASGVEVLETLPLGH